MEIDPKELVAKSSSSDSGISLFKKIDECPALYALQKLSNGVLSGKIIDTNVDPEAAEEEGLETSWHAKVGILFHKLMELYYGGNWEKITFKFYGEDELPEWHEALRLFRAYKLRFPADEWEIVCVEQDFAMVSHPAFGIPRFTGRIDMGIRIKPGREQYFLQNRGIGLVPGFYLLDHKVKWRRNAVANEEWQANLQFKAYGMAWDALHPEEPIKGILANVVYAYKQQKRDPTKGGPAFETFLASPANAHEREVVRQFLKQQQAVRDSKKFPARLAHCFRWQGRVCEMHPSIGGPCNLIGYEVKENE